MDGEEFGIYVEDKNLLSFQATYACIGGVFFKLLLISLQIHNPCGG